MLTAPPSGLQSFVILLAATTVAAMAAPRAQDRPPEPPAAAQRPTFRVEANFVRVDAYPTRNGAAVRDLTVADFQILEDGKPQKIETFEHVEIRGGVPQSERREPNSVAEGREAAEDPRSRVFVVFLDTYHTEIEGSHRIRKPLIDLLERIIGPEDLFAVMTPEMSAADLTFARKTGTIEGMLSRYWFWGRRDRLVERDPEEQMYEECFPESGGARDTGYAGVAWEMIQRRREKRVLDALSDVSAYLRGVREERKAVIAITSGWLLFRPDLRLARVASDDSAPMGGQIGIGPDGRLTTDRAAARNVGGFSQHRCNVDRLNLAQLDNWQEFHDILDRANRSNVSFYPIDSKGLAAVDAPIGPRVPPPPSVDRMRLTARIENLRTLAEATDGLAVVNSNDLQAGVRRIVDDLTSYYLLGYYSTNTALDGKYRKLQVRVTRPGIDVRARRGYRAATTEEVEQGRALTAAAAAAAPVSAVQSAIGALAGLRPDLRLRTQLSWAAAPVDDSIAGAKSTIWAVAEIEASTAKSPEWAAGGEVDVLVTDADGTKLADSKQPLAPGSRLATLELADVPLTPGADIVVRVRLKPSGGGLPLMDTLRFAVPESAGLVGEARVLRRGPSTGIQYLPTADQRFRRTDRIRVELPVFGTPDEVSAELLDRNGQPMALPVAATTRPGGEGPLRWAVADLTLAPLAPGDYVVKTSVRNGGTRQERVTAFRIVP